MNAPMRDRKILIFAEDPGAANFVVPLPAALAEIGIQSVVLAAGHAVEFFADLDISHHSLTDNETAADVLDAHRPNLVLVGTSENPETIGLQLIAEARRRKIISVGAIDGPAFPEFRFRGRSDAPLQFAPDWLAVPDRSTADRYVELGCPVDRTMICGHPHFDRVREECRWLGQEEMTGLRRRVLGDEVGSRPVVVFIAELSDGFRPEDFQWTPEFQLRGRGESRQRTQIVLEEVLDAMAQLDPKPYIVLRLAPKNRVDEFSAYVDEIDCISHQGPVLPLLYVADLVVGMTSMPVFEAAIIGRSTLSVLPLPEQRRWLPSIDLGLTRLATSRAEVRRQIGLGLEDGPPRAVDDLIPVGAAKRLSHFLDDL